MNIIPKKLSELTIGDSYDNVKLTQLQKGVETIKITSVNLDGSYNVEKFNPHGDNVVTQITFTSDTIVWIVDNNI